MDLNSLEEEVLKKIKQADLNTALELVQKFVESVLNDSYALATVYGSERLDSLCLAIGQALGSNKELSTLPDGVAEGNGEYVVTIATEFGRYGGHTLVAEDTIKAQAEKSHIVLLTDLYNRADIDYLADRFHPIAELRSAPRGTALQKLVWLLEQLDGIKPVRIFLFNHHQDAVAIAGVQPWLGATKIIFYHHADHNLCLGVHLPKTIHIDPHNLGYHNCKIHEHLKGNFYLPLVIDDRCPRPATLGFLQHRNLRTCSSGTSIKFDLAYIYSYRELIVKRLELRNGVHVHIGNLPDGMLESIRNRLAAEGVDSGRFIHIPWVQSLWSSLIENEIDLYISSFPLGGGRAAIEVMGSGTPLLVHQNSMSRYFGGVDLAYPEAIIWNEPAEFYEHIRSLTPQTLAEHSSYARGHYESFHLPSLMVLELDNICEGKITMKAPPLKPYEFNHLQRYLHYRALGIDKIKSVHEEQIAGLDGQIANLKQCNASLSENIVLRNSELDGQIANLKQCNASLSSENIVLRNSTSFRVIALMRQAVQGIRALVRVAVVDKRCIVRMPPGVIGNLDQPLAEANLRQNFVNLSGWVFSRKTPVTKVYATVNGFSEQVLTYGQHREDVHQAYLNDAAAIQSGFSGIVTWKSQAASPVKIDIWVETQTGEKIRCLSSAVDYCRTPTKKQRLSLLYGFMVVVLRKTCRVYREGPFPMSPSVWWSALRRNYRLMFAEMRDPVRFQFGEISTLITDPYEQWIETNRITSKLEALMLSDARYVESHAGAKISIVVPVYNTPQRFVEEMVDSVRSQFYRSWELILVDDASTQPHVREILSKLHEMDNRIRVVFRAVNGHISEATNDGLKEATGEFIALLDHDDTLPQDVLLHVAECIARYPEVDWIYTDEDKIDAKGRRYDPKFKAGWSPEMAITHNYTHHLTVIRKTLVDKVGGMRKGFEGAQDLDLFLRVEEVTTPDNIKHIPQIGYHWRSHEESTASKGRQKAYVFDSAARSIQDALSRRRLDAECFLPPIVQKYGMCLNQLRWKDSLGSGKKITILIPTKDRVDLLKRCISSLHKTCNKHFVKILIMDDRSSDDMTLKYFQELESGKDLECRVVRPKRGDGTFNYARLINEAADYVDTPYLLQLNNDVEAINLGWLEDMMGWMSIDGVGVVGARLLYPDHTLQHAGVVIGSYGGLADHQFHQFPDSDVGYLALPHVARNVSAVTGACLLTTMELFRKLRGFDEINFAVEYNDVDFCLRVIESGKRVVYTPQAKLTHLASATRGNSFNPQEHINFIKKYKQYKDVFYNRSIRQDLMWMPVDGGRFSHVDRIKKIRILLISHTLTLTGAPIVAFELARHFASVMGFEVTVLALQDGPVHKMYNEEGISVLVTDELMSLHLMDADRLQIALLQIDKQIQVDGKFDLIVCNTITTFWGVLLASQLKIPSVWHIHESLGMERYVSMFSDPSMENMVFSAFFKANRIVFQSNATREIYGEFEAFRNICTIPGSLSLERIDKFRQANTKDALREKYGIPDDVYVVVLIGTTCERKGQLIFLDAIQRMSSKELPAKISFLVVGAIESLYLEMLREKIALHNLHNVQLVSETRDIYDYYGLSDLFVCASFEESFPMVVLLAMAFELPIVSTNVFGIPEIVSDEQEALLVSPGDSCSMATALLQCINAQDEANAMAGRAYAKVYRLFDSDILYAKHTDLARKVTMEETRAT
jgi:O-antigen biosynthesis protein